MLRVICPSFCTVDLRAAIDHPIDLQTAAGSREPAAICTARPMAALLFAIL